MCWEYFCFTHLYNRASDGKCVICSKTCFFEIFSDVFCLKQYLQQYSLSAFSHISHGGMVEDINIKYYLGNDKCYKRNQDMNTE